MKPRLAVSPLTWGVSELPGWGWQMPAERVLSEAARLGVRGLEAGPAGFLKPALWTRRPKVVAGVAAAVLHVPEARHAQVSRIEREVRRLAELEAELLVVAAVAGRPNEGAADLDGRHWAQLLNALGSCDAICKRHGLRFCVHPQFGGVVDSAEAVERILVGSEVGFCLDTGDLSLIGLDPVEFLETARERVFHVHLKDLSEEVAAYVRDRRLNYHMAVFNGLVPPISRGSVKISAVLDCLARLRYPGWLVLEQDRVLAAEPPPGEGPLAEAALSLTALRELAV